MPLFNPFKIFFSHIGVHRGVYTRGALVHTCDAMGSEQTDPRKTLPTYFVSWMGYRITPYNPSELINFKLTYIF